MRPSASSLRGRRNYPAAGPRLTAHAHHHGPGQAHLQDHQEPVIAFVVVWAWVFVVLFLRGEEALKASS